MSIDLHNHTKLCNHAYGKNEEYVLAAIKSGAKIFGFSDHAPMLFDEGYRMKFDEMQKYEDEILFLKTKYANQIDIKLGYEVDYLPDYMDERVLNANVDYLIGSVHFINKWGFDNPEFIGGYQDRDLNELWLDYFTAIEELAKSNLFDIVGHLDLLKIFNFLPKKDIVTLASPALEAIKNANMVIELNAAGLRKDINEQYPSIPLLKKAKELGVLITFGSDAHDPSQVGFKRKELIELAKAIGFNEAAYFENRKIRVVKI